MLWRFAARDDTHAETGIAQLKVELHTLSAFKICTKVF